VEAARELFLARGYGATTVEAIAEASGVPAPTVYRLFSSKLGVLTTLLDVSIAGDTAEEPVADRPAVRRLLADPDPARRIAGFASLVADINARVGPLYRMLVGASDSDEGAAALLANLAQQRRRGQLALVRSLATDALLRRDLTERTASDIVHALASPEVHHLLVVDRSWARTRYERWLASTLAAQLLPVTAEGG
jgi:AcrR family transcriptional regulator